MDNILSSKIVSAILKKAVPRKAALPILETVHFDDGFIEATDLDVTVRIPYSYPGGFHMLPAKDFIENIDEAFKLRTRLEKATVRNAPDVAITEAHFWGGATIQCEDHQDFPIIPVENSIPLGRICVDALEKLVIASEYVSKDQLRLALMCVYFGGTELSSNKDREPEICATDGHRLYWTPNSSPLLHNILLSVKTISILSTKGLDQTWDVSAYVTKDGKTETHLEFVNGDGVRVIQQIIYERFPNYHGVIPDDVPYSLSVDKKEFAEVVAKARECSTKINHQISMEVNGSLIVSAEDADSGKSFHADVSSAYYKGEAMTVGCNAQYLLSILKTIKGKEVKIQIISPTRAMIVNGSYLLMPLRLNS